MKREKTRGLTVVVKDGNVEKAIRKFKKLVQESGILDEVKERMEYVKPSITRVEEENKARRRWLKKVEQQEMSGLRPPRKDQRKRLY
jgi:small subunit ribosomal protein S21